MLLEKARWRWYGAGLTRGDATMFVTKKKHERDIETLQVVLSHKIGNELDLAERTIERLIERAASRRKDARRIAIDIDYHLNQAASIREESGSEAAYEYLSSRIAKALATVDRG